jgi:branched-chain amino acid aminotransferase
MTDARKVWWNGAIVAADEARVSVLDTGFLYGDGVYDTMRSYGGRVFAIERHLARLVRSAQRVVLRLPERGTLRRAIEEAVAANGGGDHAVRITVTRGRLAKRLDLSTAGPASVLVSTDPIEPFDDERRRRGIRVVWSRYVRLSAHPLAGVKSTNYQVSLFARNEAREAGATEVLLANESGAIVEGAAANVFLVEGRRLVTPALTTGILGGITREVVLELAQAKRLAVEEAVLPRERIETATEVFMTGTTIQVAPVVEIAGRAVGAGRPGPLSLELLEGYLAAVAKDVATPRPIPAA